MQRHDTMVFSVDELTALQSALEEVKEEVIYSVIISQQSHMLILTHTLARCLAGLLPRASRSLYVTPLYKRNIIYLREWLNLCNKNWGLPNGA